MAIIVDHLTNTHPSIQPIIVVHPGQGQHKETEINEKDVS